VKDYGKAKTLADLQEKIKEAINEFGSDAEWYGYDDGSITVLVNDTSVAFIESEAFTAE
jgi:hypothetical protein